MNFILYERLQACGVLGLCAEIVNIGSDADAASLAGPDGYLAQVREGQSAIVEGCWPGSIVWAVLARRR